MKDGQSGIDAVLAGDKEYLLTRFVWMGWPQAEPSEGKRGRPSKKTQYDKARERKSGRYQRLVRLPRIGKTVQHQRTHNHAEILEIAEAVRLLGIKRGIAKHVLQELARRNRPTPSPATIRKILKRYRLN